MKAITNLASPLVMIISLSALMVFTIYSKMYLEEVLLIVLSAFSVLIGTFCKIWLERPRPNENDIIVYVEEKSYNFPSTHASIAISLFGFLSYLAFLNNYFTAAWLLVGFAALICFSRIFLGVHYFSDVIGGMYLGGFVLLVLIWLYAKIPEDIINTKHMIGVLALSALCLLIYYRRDIKNFMRNKSEREKRLAVGTFLGLVVILLVHTGGLPFAFLILINWIMGMREIIKIAKNKTVLYTSAFVFTLLAANAINLRLNNNQGEFLINLALIAAWSTDSAAYFFGKRFGKTKIFAISPNKSLEGTIGGILACVLIINGIFYQEILALRWQILVASIFLSVTAILGDLTESWFKRINTTKESDDILLSHGGFLDRIDSSFVNMLTVNIFRFWS